MNKPSSLTMRKIALFSIATAVCLTPIVLHSTQAQAADISVNQFGTTAVEQPVSVKQGQATGKFYTKDGVLFGPDGKQFIPQGTNAGVSGSVDWGGSYAETSANNSWGSGKINGHLKETKEWGFNTIRLNLLVTDEYSYSQVAKYGFNYMMNDIQKIVDEYANNGIVVILDPHDNIKPSDATVRTSIQNQVEKFYTEAAKRWGQNSYVWFGSPNEPDYINDEWVALNNRYIKAVRAQGSDNIFSVNVPTWGQDLGNVSSFPGAKRSYAADMMPKLQTTSFSDGKGGQIVGNLLTEQHNYGGDCAAPQFTSFAALNDYADKVANGSGVPNGGTPLLFGEFGYDATDDRPVDAPNPKDIWGGTAWSTWKCSFAPEKRASDTTLNAAKVRGVGLLFWHATFGGDGRSFKKSCHPYWGDGVSNLNLSEQGQHMWNLTHEPTLSVSLSDSNNVNGSLSGTANWVVKASDSPAEAVSPTSGGIARTIVSLDGKQAYSGSGNGAPSFSPTQSFDTTKLSGGNHTLTARTYDTAGNVREVSKSFVVQNTKVTANSLTASSFGFNSTNFPVGGKLSIIWKREGVVQSSSKSYGIP